MAGGGKPSDKAFEMRIFDVRDEAPMADRRPAITMGVFDGVHLGHRAIFGELRSLARRGNAPALAVTFETHPRQALGRSAPPGITSFGMRLRLIAETGIDGVWVLPFTHEFSQRSARDFAEEFFHRRLNASAVVLGASASFGREREGNARTLSEWAGPWRMAVKAVPPVHVDGAVVSSTAVRLAVQSGDLEKAAKFLGRPFSVEGTVVHGQGHGRRLGFPTLNLDPHHELRPPPGVYLTYAVLDGRPHPSVTNIGRPPTEDEIAAGLADFLIETHLIDYHGDLYGRTAEVVFLRKTRDVIRFDDPASLMERVGRDLGEARAWFGANG